MVDYTPGGVAMAGGALDMIWVTGVLFGGFAVGALLFYSGGRTQYINQLDNYAGGHFLDADTRYQYSDNFYAGLMRVIKPWYRGSFLWLESALHSLANLLSGAIHSLYRVAQSSFYLLVVSVLAMLWVIL